MNLFSLSGENFGCYESIETEIYNQTLIGAPNATGKTTLAAMIVWCLTGTDLNGKQKADTRLVRHGATSMSVTTGWRTDLGKEISITRIRPETGAMTVLINGKKEKPGEIMALFGDVDEFLSIFIPGYFSALEPKNARRLLAKCLPDIPKEQVMERLTPEQREAIEHDKLVIGLDSVKFLAEKVRKEIAEHERESTRLEGELRPYTDILAQDLPQEPVSKISAELRQEYEDAKRKLDTQKLLGLTKDKALQPLLDRQQELGKLYREKRSERDELLQVQEEHSCHTCGQALPADKVHETLVKRKQKIATIQESMDNWRAEGDRLVVEIARVQSLPDDSALDPTLTSVVAQFTKAESEDTELKVAYNSQVNLYKRAEREILRVRNEQEMSKALIEKAKQKLQTLLSYSLEYVRLQHTHMNKLFTAVKINLVDANLETGEIRDIFRIDWNNKPYKTLSTSERVRCDIEIGRVFAEMSGETMPVFVDDAERIQDLFEESFSGQVLAAYVQKRPSLIVVDQANPGDFFLSRDDETILQTSLRLHLSGQRQPAMTMSLAHLEEA